MIRRIKNFLRRERLRRLGLAEELACERVTCGTEGGAWVVCPAGLSRESVVYSFGLGRDVSFDLDVIRNWGAQVHGFDPTPASLEWLREQSLPPQFHLHPYGLGAVDGEVTFFPPRRKTSSHFSPVQRYRRATAGIKAEVRRLDSIVRDLGHDRIDVLKIDIEGGEYAVLGDVVRCPATVKQLLVEFHHGFEGISIGHTVGALRMLRDAGFRIFSISDRVKEFSLMRV